MTSYVCNYKYVHTIQSGAGSHETYRAHLHFTPKRGVGVLRAVQYRWLQESLNLLQTLGFSIGISIASFT